MEKANEQTHQNSGRCHQSHGREIHPCVDDRRECKGRVKGVCGEKRTEVGAFEAIDLSSCGLGMEEVCENKQYASK